MVDPTITPEKPESPFVLATETPRRLYQPSESSEDSDETHKPSTSSRKKLNEFLACRDVSPIRYHLKKPWNLAADRTQRYHTRKARQVVTAALEEIAPQDTENLWNSLVKSKRVMQPPSSEEEEPLVVTLIDALAECYNNASHWSTRRQILSIIADKVSFQTLQRWIPGLIRYRFNTARHHRLLHGRGSVIPTPCHTRMYVAAEQLDHFLDFITSANIVQDLPFGERKLKLSSKEKIIVPNVVRTVIPDRIVQQYNLFSSEAGFVPMGRSTLLRILNVCSASVRNSLQGLDYFTAQGSKAFDDLENVVDRLGDDCGMGLSWAKETKAQLKAAKRYLKGDYKVNRVNVLSAGWGIRGTYCRLRAAFSSQKCQFFTSWTDPKLVNNLFIFSPLSLSNHFYNC